MDRHDKVVFKYTEGVIFIYRKCPKCGKQQHFKDRKKGDTVRCIKCGQEFVLK